MSTSIDLLSNWTDITYKGDQIRFATTALNEIYVDFAKDDEIIMDKSSGWFSYKRKDGQYIRPDVERFSYSSFLRDIMSCTRSTFRLNKSDWDKIPSFVWYNFNPTYNNNFLEISKKTNSVDFLNRPQYYCDITANPGFFIKPNADMDSLSYLGILDDKSAVNRILIRCTIYIFDNNGNSTRTVINISCQLNQYTFVSLSKYCTNNSSYMIIDPSAVALARNNIKDDTINEEDAEVIGLNVNGGNLVITSFDVVTQVYLDAESKFDLEYRYRTKLHKILTSVGMCRIESPGQSDVTAEIEYIYPCKLNLIIPETKINDYMRIDQINCIPKEKGVLTDKEEEFFCNHLNDEPYAIL